MKFVYKPEGTEPKKWDFAPRKLLVAELIEIEKRTGLAFEEWSQRFRSSSALAIHAYLYVMLKRELPTLKWDDLSWTMDEVDFELGDDEASTARAALEAKRETAEGLTGDEAALLESLVADGVQLPADDDPKG